MQQIRLVRQGSWRANADKRLAAGNAGARKSALALLAAGGKTKMIKKISMTNGKAKHDKRRLALMTLAHDDDDDGRKWVAG